MDTHRTHRTARAAGLLAALVGSALVVSRGPLRADRDEGPKPDAAGRGDVEACRVTLGARMAWRRQPLGITLQQTARRAR